MGGAGYPNASYPMLPDSCSAGLRTLAEVCNLPISPPTPISSVPPPTPVAVPELSGVNGSKSKNEGQEVEMSGDAPGDADTVAGGEQDKYVTIANMARLIRVLLQTQVITAEEAKEALQNCISDSIDFTTKDDKEQCSQGETEHFFTAEEVAQAMRKFGLDDYIQPVTLYLQRYRELEEDAPPDVKQQQQPQHLSMAPQGDYSYPVDTNIPQYPFPLEPPTLFPNAGTGSASGDQELQLLAALSQLNYYSPEAPAHRDMLPAELFDATLYLEVPPAYTNPGTYRGVGGSEKEEEEKSEGEK